LEERGLMRIYEERLKVLPVVYGMESRGITLSRKRHAELKQRYGVDRDKWEKTCVGIAERAGEELELPKGGVNNSLLTFVFGKLGCAPRKGNRKKKTDRPSLDKGTIETYIGEYAEGTVQHAFFRALVSKRKCDTALSYLEGYERFWMPLRNWGAVLYPSLNPTGTDTLRWSSSNPNEQNISKQDGFNLRYCFGPLEGREWWSLDAENIELRIPAYEAGEEEMIALFERPDDPPYFGSNHLLVFDILHRKRLKLDTHDPEYLLKAKKQYAATWYQWTKNGNFAVQYGAVEESGTADRAYHVPGAQRIIQSRFTKSAALNKRLIEQARKTGYIETMPDKAVDPERGYPLLCSRSRWGDVLPTVPLNYHVQGTAMWWMMKAMIRCQEYLDSLGGDYRMIMQVHDELVFDFPKGTGLPKVRKIRRLMEMGGDDIGVPTPVKVTYHESNWGEGK
jgi:DNA polymerase-1